MVKITYTTSPTSGARSSGKYGNIARKKDLHLVHRKNLTVVHSNAVQLILQNLTGKVGLGEQDVTCLGLSAPLLSAPARHAPILLFTTLQFLEMLRNQIRIKYAELRNLIKPRA